MFPGNGFAAAKTDDAAAAFIGALFSITGKIKSFCEAPSGVCEPFYQVSVHLFASASLL
jgi:hypothetical protein